VFVVNQSEVKKIRREKI